MSTVYAGRTGIGYSGNRKIKIENSVSTNTHRIRKLSLHAAWHCDTLFREINTKGGKGMKCTVIGITGGTGSGKSTFTNRLKNAFPDDVTVIYHDNYYRCQDDVSFEERKKVNYDHPDSLETDLLLEHLKMLKEGKGIECPVYDYSAHNRSKETLHIEPKRIILVEGILLLTDPRVRELLDIKIYVDADADERILRRITRDVKERGRDLDNIVEQYLTTVKPMHYLYVEPMRNQADIVVNSGMNNVAFDVVRAKIRDLLKEG